jgi:putative PEP-CTERM system histidine kinase
MINMGVLSYSAGALGFLVLLLLLITSWRGRLQGALLVVAVFTNLLWALAAAYYADGEFRTGVFWYAVLEIARNTAWFAFLLQLLAPLLQADSVLAKALRWRYSALFLVTGLLLLAEWLLGPLSSYWLGVNLGTVGHVGLAIAGLALIEQLFRNTRPEQRWASKFLYLGIGTLFAYDFFLYADALLFRYIDPQIWYARGFINAIVVPLIAVSAARNPAWSMDVFVSRRIVIHSVSILGAGLYLLVMAGVGYYIRLYGGTWGSALQLVFLVGAGILLLMLLFSGQLRAATKLFLSQHFFQYKYDYREEWLKFINTLSTNATGGPLRERAIHAIAGILHSTGGLLWTRGETHQFFLAASWNMGETTGCNEPGDSPFSTFLERRQLIIELDACESEPEFYASLVLPPWLQPLRPQAWIVIPLLQGDNLRGFMVLARPRARHQLNWEDRDLLQTAGRQVASYLALLDATEALLDVRQFEAFNRLSAYVVHDLKNIAAQLSLVVANAARHKSNPAFVDDAIRTVANATTRMNLLLAQLRKGNPPSREVSVLNLAEVLREVIRTRSDHQPVPVLAGVDAGLYLCANRERCIAVLEHLIQNAQEATARDGRVEVKACRAESMAVVTIADNGCGMEARFIRERLFRPFHTTKGNAGMGIGVYESREFVHALGGKIEVISKPGGGTTFFLHLPLVEATTVSRDSRETATVN